MHAPVISRSDTGAVGSHGNKDSRVVQIKRGQTYETSCMEAVACALYRKPLETGMETG